MRERVGERQPDGPGGRKISELAHIPHAYPTEARVGNAWLGVYRKEAPERSPHPRRFIMRYLFVLAMFLGTLAPAVAQETEPHYYPLEVGDMWEYEYYRWRCNEPDGCTNSTEFYRRTIVGEVEVEGVRYAEMQVERLRVVRGDITCTSMHTVRVNPETDRVEIGGLPGCGGFVRDASPGSLNEEDIPLTVGEPEVRTVVIGGMGYELNVRHAFGLNGCFEECEVQLASEVGLHFFSATSSFGPGESGVDLLLRYAEVGGVVYGTSPVANEDEVAPATFALGAPFPNPFRTTATLTLSLPTPEAVTLSVFDVLGRRVLTRDLGVQPAGASRHTLDGAELPVGVYFVRAVTGSGQQATRRVVRVE